jgi:colanic acid/amylovoran biosynthesis glycosyltransferase
VTEGHHPSVLAVVNQFPTPSQTFITRKLDGLRAAGVEVTVAATAFADDAITMGHDLVPLTPWRNIASTVRQVGAGRSARIAGGMARALTTATGLRPRRRLLLAPLLAAHADIVHFEFSGIAASYLDLLEHLGTSRLVVSCRGAAESIQPLADPSRAGVLAEVFQRVDAIHCVSEDMARTVARFSAPPDKILVNRPAIPVASFATLAERRRPHPGPLRVLSVGRLHWKKGLDDGLRAIAAARTLGVDLEHRIVGEGAEREKLLFLRDELGLAGRVELLGARPEADVREMLEWADVLLLPSLSEGISNAVLEAMASGLPVLATSCGGLTEVIDSDRDGFTVDVGDVPAMATVLARLGDDPGLRASVGRAAAERASAEFDISGQVRRFVDCYDRLVS